MCAQEFTVLARVSPNATPPHAVESQKLLCRKRLCTCRKVRRNVLRRRRARKCVMNFHCFSVFRSSHPPSVRLYGRKLKNETSASEIVCVRGFSRNPTHLSSSSSAEVTHAVGLFCIWMFDSPEEHTVHFKLSHTPSFILIWMCAAPCWCT